MLHITRPFNPPSQSILAITRDIAESAQTMNWAMQSSAGNGGGQSGGQSGGAKGGNRGGAQGGGNRGGRKEGEQQQQAVEAK